MSPGSPGGKNWRGRPWLELNCGWAIARRCALFREADQLLATGGREIPDFLAAAYLQGRAEALTAEQATIAPATLRASLHNLREAAAHPDGRYLAVALLRMRAQVESAAGKPVGAVEVLRQTAAAAAGVVNPFEELRLQTLITGKLAEAGDMAAAGQQIEAALAAARGRKAEAGPSYWMLLADGDSVQARRRT